MSAWLSLAAVTTILIGLVYAVVQQNYRQNANDPQIQLAEDAAAQLNSGALPASVVPSNQINQTTSLAPFMVVLDKNLFSTDRISPTNILATNAVRPVDTGAVLLPVLSVFRTAEQKGERRFTWETAGGLRFATVVLPYQNGFVLVARSLREVELRELQVFNLALVAWLIGLISTFSLSWWRLRLPNESI